ncbi:ABC transporter ATP-binding protein [Halalkalibacter alkaliphilus]|uniref:ABC transporter ATP-binding protein n=1 Tax=Halalkalibacter alkaliphilus TaxID=2917993 RepID=A0A9X1ZW75_9BACI|nr:ABC transporter ATP-binding protein [Halalkalibacter alkaliphilus]MCL7745536.1 ABC transporter ATP-binding protein [Halalkalibacter alkaliphilus]
MEKQKQTISQQQPILQIKNLKKTIGKTTLIHGISLDLYPGEVFGFLGPNGAGKTTTIRMIVGLMSITDGEVIINGHSVEKNFEKAIANIGGIIENPEMYKFMSGYDNLIHYSRMVPNIPKGRIDEIVKLVGLHERIHEKVKTYSLGMRQRLGLAQALLHSPKLLILDEPTNGLDPAGIREIRTYIRRIATEENMTVFVSSHLLSEMELMCDRIGIIHHGKLISVEKVKNMVEDNQQISVQFKVTPLEKAIEFFKAKYPNELATISGEYLLIGTQEETITEYTKLFVNNGFKITGINGEQKTLEDKFLEITGGEQHV